MYKSNCTGYKYYIAKPSLAYRAVVEGCSRQDWKGITRENKCSSKRISCYVPDSHEERR